MIWDSGATACISNDRAHFVGNFSTNTKDLKLEGIGSNLAIEGAGHVSWNVEDTQGSLRTLHLPAYYVPKATSNLLSINALLQAHPNETVSMTPTKLVLSGTPLGNGSTPVHVSIDPATNLPTCIIRSTHNGEPPKAMNILLTAVHDENKNLSTSEKELLRWHQRLGHLSFHRYNFSLTKES